MTIRARESKTRLIKEWLLRDMTEQRIPIGARLPSESELMEQFAVSRTTVRQALSELTSEGLVAKRQGKGTFRVTPAERRRRGDQSMLVGVWFNWPSGPLYGPMFDGIRSELVHWGYHAVLEGGLEAGAEQQGIRNLIRKGMDGFIVAPSSNPFDGHEPILDIIHRGTPLILIDKRPTGFNADLVATNSRLGAEALVSHLLALGHRRIGFIGTADVTTVEEREQSYQLTLRKNGVTPDPSWIGMNADVFADSGRQAARAMLSLPRDRRPTAIFGANDPTALTVIEVAREMGLRVPEDLSVVGFDAAGFHPDEPAWLTTYAQPKYRIGQQAAQLLMSRLARPAEHVETVLLDGELILGGSSGPVAAS